MHGSSLIGANIRARRTELGMSCADLARAADLSYSFTNKLERGDRGGASVMALLKISRALSCSVDDLITSPTAPVDVA